MPTISMFYGIIIRMYYTDHNPPHLHIFYGDYKAKIDLEGNVFDGNFPNRETKLIQAWIEIHKEELFANWELAKNGEKPFRIIPLK